MVQTGPGVFTRMVFDVPHIGDDEALVAVEACGICGTDAETFTGGIPLQYPVIPGHEPVGRITAIGDRAAARWRVQVGDRVVLQSDIGCGRCVGCIRGDLCVVDPPFITEDVWRKYAEAVRLCLRPGGKVMCTTVAENEGVLFAAA